MMRHCRRPAGSSDPEWLFRDMNMAHRMAMQAVFNRNGVGELGQPLILFVLEDCIDDGVIPTQKELAEKLNISPATVTISLKSLERRGYVRKIADGEDLRCNRIEITSAGRITAERCRRAFDEIDKAMYTGFSDNEKSLLSGFYTRMMGNLLTLAESAKTPRGSGEVR